MSSFPSMSVALGGSSGEKNGYIRMSPTSFFNTVANVSSPLPNNLGSQSNVNSPSSQLVSTPKSHHRKTNGRLCNASSTSSARKKLCYPDEEGISNKSTPLRNVCFVPKFIQSKTKKSDSQQGLPIDSFSTNVYATPPRHSLRRQQSASATLVTVGNGRFLTNGRPNTAFVRFTPPIGEDVSTLFAGSKFSDSPSAKSLPPPPSNWLEEVSGRTSKLSIKSASQSLEESKALKGLNEDEELTSDVVLSDDTGVIFDLSDGKSTDGKSPSPSTVSDSYVSDKREEEEEVCMKSQQGLRIHPLQLIAAVAAS